MNDLFSPRLWLGSALGLVVLMLIPTAALAYIDPGTGSFVIQGIIGAVIGGAFAIKLYWNKIKAALTGKSLEEEEDIAE